MKQVQPKVVLDNNITDVSYITDWSTVTNKPPISYDELSSTTKVNSPLNVNGDITTSGKVYNAVWNDYAELFLKGEDTPVGCIVSSNANDSKVYLSNRPDDILVVGVVSDSYGHLLGGDAELSLDENLDKYAPVGLVGRVRVKVVGRVKPGDLITSSLKSGYGKASTKHIPGSIVGKALTYDQDGEVLMLIMMR